MQTQPYADETPQAARRSSLRRAAAPGTPRTQAKQGVLHAVVPEGAADAGGDAERHTLVDMRTDNLKKKLLPAKSTRVAMLLTRRAALRFIVLKGCRRASLRYKSGSSAMASEALP